jgi:glycosyltransferase involved in cell wall biosynthesis
MVLVDAVYINNSGGKILLDYLIQQLEKTDIEIYYLLDKRIENRHPVIKSENKVQYLKGGLFTKYKFYSKNNLKFNIILCFGNFPPPLKQKSIVYTYFHQLLFIQSSKYDDFLFRFSIKLKTILFSFYSKNSNFWIVQTELIKEALADKFSNIILNKIFVLPFYPSLKYEGNISRISNRFLYVSTGLKYKNHYILINAFINFFDKYKTGELHLTIGIEFIELVQLIKTCKNMGYPIINHGIVDKYKLIQIYQSSEYVVFPSLAESFGLGIVEGIENGCKIIASDLPWLHSVCEPSLVFNPYSQKSIEESLESAILNKVKLSKTKVTNEIQELILLINNNFLNS